MLWYPFGIQDIEGEIWRDIEDYEDDYQISNFGRLKSFKNGQVKILKPHVDKDGYLQSVFTKNGKHKWFKLHRLVATAFIPNLKNKPQVNHIDGHKMNNHVSNLEWVSQSENNLHAAETGLIKSGEDHCRATLKNEEAIWCRKVYKPRDKDFGATALARKLGVTREIIKEIVRGKTYKNVK